MKIDNNGDAVEDVTFRFTFKTTYKQPDTFLYALPGVASITDANLLVTQTYSLDRIIGPGHESARGERDPPPHGPAGPAPEHRAQDDAELRRAPERDPDAPQTARSSSSSARARIPSSSTSGWSSTA